MNKIPTVQFDSSSIDKTKGVNINVQLMGDFVVACVSEEGVKDRAIAFEIAHYSNAEKVSYLSKFFKAISSTTRYNTNHFKGFRA